MPNREPINFNPGESPETTYAKWRKYSDLSKCFWCGLGMRNPEEYACHEAAAHVDYVLTMVTVERMQCITKKPAPINHTIKVSVGGLDDAKRHFDTFVKDCQQVLSATEAKLMSLRAQADEVRAEAVALEQRKGHAIADIIQHLNIVTPMEAYKFPGDGPNNTPLMPPALRGQFWAVIGEAVYPMQINRDVYVFPVDGYPSREDAKAAAYRVLERQHPLGVPNVVDVTLCTLNRV